MSRSPCIISFERADPAQVDQLGAKGAKLVEDFQNVRHDFPDMQPSITVPDGFILTTDVWKQYHENGDRLSDDLFADINRELAELGTREAKYFGNSSGALPLIVAVRGGAPVSLPGAISTILNVGLNDEVVSALIDNGEDEAFVLSTYLNAVRIYGEVVLGIPYQRFYETLQHLEIADDTSVPPPLLRRLLDAYKSILAKTRHPKFPSGFEMQLSQQLRYAIEAVLDSWMSLTAVEARLSRKPNVPEDMGTAVIIQCMVFGNRNAHDCLSGVLFTRDQRTGASHPVIEWAPQVQCDQIVSGKLRKKFLHTQDLQKSFPDVYDKLLLVRDRFEERARRPLDVEFTVESRKVFILQRRPLRMTSNATVRAMWDFVDEGKTTIQLASMIINNALEQSEKVLRSDFKDYQVLARGQPVNDTADSGILAFGTQEAMELAEKGHEVVLLRKHPYGEVDVAINHPLIRGVIRCDGNTTGHEAVSAVAYSKPYLINVSDEKQVPIVVTEGDNVYLNPECSLAPHMGKRVFVDGERGIVGVTDATSFLEDRRSRKKLYVDWEYVRQQFEAAGYQERSYEELLEIHYKWELQLEKYQRIKKALRRGERTTPEQELLDAFYTYLSFVPPKNQLRVLELKDVHVEDFDFGPPLTFHGEDLEGEVLKIMRALMLCITWRTHWIHELMVVNARQRGENENDVIRDIFLKNRTMSLMNEFEQEGFHLMKVPNRYYLIFASNFEYDQDLDKVQIGPDKLGYGEKERLARHFLSYLGQTNPSLAGRVHMVQGAPPLGQGHARIISIGISIPPEDFDLVCRYLRTYLEQSRQGCTTNLQQMIPSSHFIELYRLDPHFAPYPHFTISRAGAGSRSASADGCMLAFGECSYGEFDGMVYGKEDYDRLMSYVKQFENHLQSKGHSIPVRPWFFEVDPYRRHSVIGAVGVQFPEEDLCTILEELKSFLAAPSAKGPAQGIK